MLYRYHSTITAGAFLEISAVRWCWFITAGRHGVVLPYRFQSWAPLGWLTYQQGYGKLQTYCTSWTQELQSTYYWKKALYSWSVLVFIRVIISSPVGGYLRICHCIMCWALYLVFHECQKGQGVLLLSQNSLTHTHAVHKEWRLGRLCPLLVLMLWTTTQQSIPDGPDFLTQLNCPYLRQ